MRRIGRLRPFTAHSSCAESYLGVAELGVGVLHPKQVRYKPSITVSLDVPTGATQRP